MGAASLERAERIADWLDGRADDVVALTETSAGAGTGLMMGRLAARGFHVVTRPAGTDRGALLAIRATQVVDITAQLGSTMPWRSPAAQLQMADGPMGVVAVYAPSRNRRDGRAERKREFFSSLTQGLAVLRERFDGRLVVLGDHNSVPRDHLPAHAGFTSWEYQWHDDLQDLGLRNVHAVLDREQPYSWVGRTGNAYLYDYAHIGDGLGGSVADFSYLADSRALGLSDHAAVSARLDSPTAARTIVS